MMKSNIDLTADEFFSRTTPRSRVGSPGWLRSLLPRKKFPWERFPSVTDEDFNHENEVFFTGNKHARKLKAECYEWDNGIKCSCCGRPLGPWDNSRYGLCHKCDELCQHAVRNESRLPWLNNLI